MGKIFEPNEFFERAWAKQNSLGLKKYISYAINEINSREYTDTLSRTLIDKMGRELTGFTREGKLSARVIGKTKEQLMYEARSLYDFLNWDFTSDEARKNVKEKYKKAYLSYLEKEGHMFISEEAYERYIELVFAFKDMSKAFDSEQIRTWFDYVENEENLSVKDLQDALIKAADKHTGPMTVEERKDLVWDILQDYMNNR